MNTTARTLPIQQEHREFLVKVNGDQVDRAQHLVSITISTTVNRIPRARLVYQDGTASDSDFPLSNTDTFVPGSDVEILAGSSGDPVTLFKGVVTRHSLRIRNVSAPQLVVECKHTSTKMTVGRKSAYYSDQTDSDIISHLFSNAGVTADVASTSVTHKQHVQYDATDWDFCLLRAEANGLVMLTRDDTVFVKEPGIDSAVCSLQFGSTILDADLQLEARYQYQNVTSISWDPVNQACVEKEAEDPGFQSPGNVGSDGLSDVVELGSYQLSHPALNEDEAQKWADGKRMYSQINRVTGSIKCEGMSAVAIGDTVTLDGLGERFNGDAFVTGVRHDFDLVQSWKTHLQFGGIKPLAQPDSAVSAVQAGGLLPGVSGLQIGIVVSNEDPDGEHRVQVKMPLVDPEGDGTWARVACPDAGEERGFFFRPEIGDEVVLGFFADDPRQAVVLGMLHSSAHPAPVEGSDDNHHKLYQSRSDMKISFDDDKIIMKFETPAGNTMEISEDEQQIKLADQHGNIIQMNGDGIVLESSQALTLKAGTQIQMESGTSFEAKGGSELKLEGAAGAELVSTAVTTISGSLVQIN